MPLSPRELFEILERLGIVVTTVTHPPLNTVADSQRLRGNMPGGHTKNLFLRDKKGNFFLVTADENAKINLKTLHSQIGASGRVSFGKPEALLELLGVLPGAVTAFAVINDKHCKVKLILDAGLMRHDVINAHPLVNDATTAIAPGDLLRFLEETDHRPQILNVSQESPH